MGRDQTQSTVTRLLGEVGEGDPRALGELFGLVYDELQLIAGRQRRRWDGDYTLNTTALVHEAYLKLVDRSRIGAEGRAHFFALASRAMRHVLCNYARAKRAQKRGGDRRRVPFDEGRIPTGRAGSLDETSDLLAALDDALRRLEEREPRQGEVVECRFFGGMTVEETATALGVSPRTVKRDYAMAQAWLRRELEG